MDISRKKIEEDIKILESLQSILTDKQWATENQNNALQSAIDLMQSYLKCEGSFVVPEGKSKEYKIPNNTEDLQNNAFNLGWDKCRQEAILNLMSVREKIVEALKTTQIGWHYPIGEKGKPTPEPKPLYLHDYRIDVGSLMKLATAILNLLTSGEEK